MAKFADSLGKEIPKVDSPYENVNHPDHPNHDDISHPKLLAGVVKGMPILTGAIIACGCAYVGLNNPESKHIFPVCGFYATTGMYCPGCGMTRALHSILGGDLIRAARFNLMLVLAIPVLMYVYVWWTTWAFSGKELPKLKFNKSIVILVCAFVVLFSVGRNFNNSFSDFFALGR